MAYKASNYKIKVEHLIVCYIFRNVYIPFNFDLLIFQVVEQGMFVKHCKVEVYLTELKLCENGNMNNVVTRRFSKADTIGMTTEISYVYVAKLLLKISYLSCIASIK